jgi:hypothetical protein
LLLFLCSLFNVHAQVPGLLSGLWEGSDRLVCFNPAAVETSSGNTYLTVVLKTFYGWYYDRTAEPVSFGTTPRTINDTTARNAEHIPVSFAPAGKFQKLSDSSDSGSWILSLTYHRNKIYYIPVAVIGGNLYLNFKIKRPVSQPQDNTKKADNGMLPAVSDGNHPLTGYWQGFPPRTSLRVSEFTQGDSIVSFYITPDAVYHIRYWRTDMSYDEATAIFSDGAFTGSVPARISCCGSVYTCVTGKSSTIRNVEKSTLPETMVIDSTGTLGAFGIPYLTLVDKQGSESACIGRLTAANKRRKPQPPPPFPPSNLDWHWDTINYLEQNNSLIQAVRERNRKFAENGK